MVLDLLWLLRGYFHVCNVLSEVDGQLCGVMCLVRTLFTASDVQVMVKRSELYFYVTRNWMY
jgi:hypothetical protein